MKTIRIVSLIGALILVISLAFDHDPQSDLNIAANAFRAGDMDSTLRLARLAAMLSDHGSREWSSSQALQARAALKLKRQDRALAILDHLLKVNPDHKAGLQMRAEIRLLRGNSGGALADLNRSFSDGTGDGKLGRAQAPHLARRSQALLMTGDLAAAAAEAERAYKLNPMDPQTLYAMSLVLEKQGKFMSALEFIEKAAYTANRRDGSFVMSPQGKEWVRRLIILRGMAKVPTERPYIPSK